MSTLVTKNLQIGADGTASNNFTVYQPVSPDGTLRIGNGNSGTTSAQVVLTSAGNVGIGTSSPTSKLSLLGNMDFQQSSNLTTTTGFLNIAPASTLVLDSAADAIHFRTLGNERMRIDSAGNVGIGRSNPSELLDVQGNILILNAGNPNMRVKASGAGNNPSYFLTADTNSWGITGIFSEATDPLQFAYNGTERMRIDSSGNLLVGTTSAAAKLTVVQGAANANGLNVTSQTVDFQTLGLHNTATSGNNFLVSFVTDASSFRGSITFNRAAGLTSFNTTSDYRAKDISGPVTDSGELIDATPVYMGKMKGAAQERPMFIAHEVPAYAHTGEKDAVDAQGNPVYQQMDASALVPVMWAELQALRQRLAAAGI